MGDRAKSLRVLKGNAYGQPGVRRERPQLRRRGPGFDGGIRAGRDTVPGQEFRPVSVGELSPAGGPLSGAFRGRAVRGVSRSMGVCDARRSFCPEQFSLRVPPVRPGAFSGEHRPIGPGVPQQEGRSPLPVPTVENLRLPNDWTGGVRYVLSPPILSSIFRRLRPLTHLF